MKWSPYACWPRYLPIPGNNQCLKRNTLARIMCLADTKVSLHCCYLWLGLDTCILWRCAEWPQTCTYLHQESFSGVMRRVLSSVPSPFCWQNHCTFCYLSLFTFVIAASFFTWILFSESIPMKSLSCHNNYDSQLTCTWMEHSEAHALVGMILYQRDNIIM